MKQGMDTPKKTKTAPIARKRRRLALTTAQEHLDKYLERWDRHVPNSSSAVAAKNERQLSANLRNIADGTAQASFAPRVRASCSSAAVMLI